MANVDDQREGISDFSGRTERVEVDRVLLEPSQIAPDAGITVISSSGQEKEDGNGSKDTASTIEPSARPVMSAVSSAGLSMPHPKRFNSVNINKRFLEKNATLPGSGPSVSTSVTAKSGSSAPKQTPDVASLHSRLVTTKLTATSRPSSTTGPGWSRPSSAAPSPTAPAPASNAIKPPSISGLTAAPQLPHVGKVIHPQPKGLIPGSSATLMKETITVTSKSVWGNSRTGQTSITQSDTRVEHDFPTAAEVAQVRSSRLNEKKQAAEVEAAQKQALQVEADTFRGVHLDPNAHHWDEMEEDDDNFLDDVIDFGDGRQYKIDGPSTPPQLREPLEVPEGEDGPSRKPLAPTIVPVSKKERFVDDFDRSWPRSNNVKVPSEVEPPSHPQPLRSPLESSKVLFNERSNRLEPYAGSQRHGPPGQAASLSSRRSSRSEHGSSPTEPRISKDVFPPGPMHNVHLLQKPDGSSAIRARGAGGHPGPGPSPTLSNDRWRDKETSRPPPPGPSSPSSTISRTLSQGRDNAQRRDHHDPLGFHGDRPSEIDTSDRRRQLSAMHSLPLPLPSTERPRDVGRQLPPHLSHQPPPNSVQPGPSSRDHLPPPPSPLTDSLVALEHHVAVPAAVAPSVAAEAEAQSSSTTKVVIDDEVRKAAMHSAADRARLRRQQEEEERERERERARRKAAELEEKMRNAEALKAQDKMAELKSQPVDESQVIEIIGEAIRLDEAAKAAAGVPNESGLPLVIPESSAQPSALHRPPSQKGAPRFLGARPSATKRTSFPVPPADAAASSAAVHSESWRSKVTGPPSDPAEQAATPIPGPTHVPFLHPPVIPEVESLYMGPDEDLEVFDFADLGQLVGAKTESATPDAHASAEVVDHSLRPRPARPVASDFFDDHTLTRKEEISWRRKAMDRTLPEPPAPGDTFPSSLTNKDTTSAESSQPVVEIVSANPLDSSLTTSSPPTLPSSVEHIPAAGQSETTPPIVNLQRSPRMSSYKEAPMSALDDTMSRIKGVLHDMHVHDVHHDARHDDVEMSGTPSRSKTVQVPVKSEIHAKPKFLPPALRSRPQAFFEPPTPEEIFDVTITEPPRSPKPAWDAFVVHLPKQSRSLEPPPKRQINMFRHPAHPIRWDILSWNPPVEGMSRRFLSVNPVLFPKGKPRYKVLLPRIRSTNTKYPTDSPGMIGPKVNLPSGSGPAATSSTGAFGRPRGADDVSSWRRPPRSSTDTRRMDPAHSDHNLETVSCSPPPDPPMTLASTRSGPGSDAAPVSAVDATLPRPRSQPKMPLGSAVAFYRDARVNIAHHNVISGVNFTVISELDELPQSDIPAAHTEPDRTAVSRVSTLSDSLLSNFGKSSMQKSSPSANQPMSPVINGQQSSPEPALPASVRNNPDSKAMHELSESVPITPHNHNATWSKAPLLFVKESPARAPDPEHLKIVWSQASDKANLPSINSLEGIADDLTALPFTVTDVKSEGGETPPPSGSGLPSRMSIQDVTRAFQQVPSSNATAHHSTPLSPSSTSYPIPRQPNLAYPPPPPHANMRPTYASYPSPMMGSPSPTMLYPPMTPSPVPGRMAVNGHTPQYSQAVWMPLPGPANPSGGMLRPLGSPYSAQMMSYPSPGNASSMYSLSPPMPMQSTSSQQSNGTQHRAGGMSVMSPVPHGAPTHPNVTMYGGSPVLVHAPHIPLTPSHPYPGPIAPAHGQPRSPYDHASGVPTLQHRPTSHHPPSQNGGYTPPSTFVRSAW